MAKKNKKQKTSASAVSEKTYEPPAETVNKVEAMGAQEAKKGKKNKLFDF